MIAVVTGANGGIGGEVTRSLAATGHKVIALGRAECDLSSLASVKSAAERIRSEHERIDLLINNAGLAGRRGITADGFELAFAVNYLSHYLLTRLLAMPELRVINVTSEAHRSAASIDPMLGLGRTRSLLGWTEYAFSKACQIAFTIEASSRGIGTYAAHPGVVATQLWRPVPQPFRWMMMRGMTSPKAGALPVIRAALDHSLRPGSYLTPAGMTAPSAVTSDRAARARLWTQSEEWVGPYLA